MVARGIMALDEATSKMFARHGQAWLTRVMLGVTALGSGAVCIPTYIFCLWLGYGPAYRIAATALIAEAILLLLVVVLRYVTCRERPVPSTWHQWAPWNRYSFPSHHAARSWLLVLIILHFYPGAQAVVLALASLICFSRLYLQKHYLSDVVAGAALGMCVGLIASRAI